MYNEEFMEKVRKFAFKVHIIRNYIRKGYSVEEVADLFNLDVKIVEKWTRTMKK